MQSNQYRVLAAHGFLATLTFNGDIYFTPYYQNNELPSGGSLELTEDGMQEHPGSGAGLIRHVEVGISMSPDVAEQLVLLLRKQLDKIQQLAGAQNATNAGE